MSRINKTLLALHVMLAVYSLCGVLSKMAAGSPFGSLRFLACYGGMIALLGVYAIGWQQVIKKMPLTSAYANRAITVIWGIIWGFLFVNETISLTSAVGAALVAIGIVLFATSDTSAGEEASE